MASLLLVNNNNKFTTQTLPMEAQWYPVYTVSIADVSDDGRKDVITGGNQSYSRIKFGAYGSGKGDVFVQDVNGRFTRIAPVQAGLNVKGDIRSAVVTGNRIIFGINNERPLVYGFKSMQ
jgi:hypothetical protein